MNHDTFSKSYVFDSSDVFAPETFSESDVFDSSDVFAPSETVGKSDVSAFS